ncbi:MAG: NAD(P)-dependent alcohol dehydrogenase [Eubacterium sp.]|nr:NAD(P)-dependent alcohol dehydrogenase [Eubacterium sp.]
MITNAAVVEEKGAEFKIVPIELGEPKEKEVLVEVKACGICHTDEVARQGIFPFAMPAVLGHEGAGVVVKTGSAVTEFKEGDRVSFSYGYCGECEACKMGKPYGCSSNRRLNFSGFQYDGTKRISYNTKDVSSFFGQSAFANHAVVHVNNLIKIDDDIPLKMAAPMGCGIQTGAGTVLNCLKPGAGTSIVIAGCGAVGLSAIMAAAFSPCSKIIAVDISAEKLELAKKYGATHTVNAAQVESVPEAVRAITDGLGADYAADCTGSAESLRTSLNSVKSLGICAAVGAALDITFQVEGELMGVAKTLVGVVEGYSLPQLFIPKLLDYYRAGKFPFDEMITYYRFEDINKAFEDIHKGKVIKAVLVMDE